MSDDHTVLLKLRHGELEIQKSVAVAGSIWVDQRSGWGHMPVADARRLRDFLNEHVPNEPSTEDRLVSLLKRCHSGEMDFRVKAREFLESLEKSWERAYEMGAEEERCSYLTRMGYRHDECKGADHGPSQKVKEDELPGGFRVGQRFRSTVSGETGKVTGPGRYFPKEFLSVDWDDGVRGSVHPRHVEVIP